MRLQKLYLFDESGQSSLILIVLHLLLIFDYALLVVLECLLHSDHVIFIRIDELGLLSLEHGADFVLEVVGKIIHCPH